MATTPGLLAIWTVACLHHTLADRQRTYSGEKVRRNTRKQPPEGWTPEALDRYFFGSKTEAASHLANNICKAYLDPEAGNPLSPLPPQRQSRLLSETNPRFLDSSAKMVDDRCTRCHRYKKNAPSVDLSHVGSKGESQCKLDHYPLPCDYVDDDGKPCDHIETENVVDKVEAVKNIEMEDKLAQQAFEIS